MQLTQKINGFVANMQRLLLSRVGFWAGQTYDMPADDASDFDFKTPSTKNKWILIIAREHYFESVAEYSIGNLSDLKKALKIEPWSFPYQGIRFVQIDRISPQSHRVTNWVIKAEVLEEQEFRPIVMVPETACLQALAASGPVRISRLGKTVLIINTDSGLLSGIEPQTSDNSTVAFWRSRLLSASGLAQDKQIDYLPDADTGAQLVKGLWRTLKQLPTTFLLPLETSSRGNYPWNKLAKMTLLVTALYLCLSSVYILMSDAWVDYRLSTASAESLASLELRKDVRSMQADVDEVATVFSRVPPLWVTWDVVLDLLNRGVSVKRINSLDGLVTITASAARATDVLTYLSNDPRVTEVKYVQPVRQSGKQQSFAISMGFNRPQEQVESTLMSEVEGAGDSTETSTQSDTDNG